MDLSSMPYPELPARIARPEERDTPRPIYAVWEITLACDLKCIHCGSRAGAKRPHELNTQESLALIEQLHQLGTREINLIGGEAYLRRDWLVLIEAIAQRGIECGLQTGARNLTPQRIRDAWDAGLRHVGISIDGLADAHDYQRGVPGSFKCALEALEQLHQHGFTTAVRTQINRLTAPQLPALPEQLASVGVQNWRLQLTVAMGRAVAQTDLLLQPFEMAQVLQDLATLQRQAYRYNMTVEGGNNIGYFGPHHRALRNVPDTFQGDTYSCDAGRFVLGIEADGTIKGCPSLPTASYAGGNVRELSVETLWNQTPQLAINRARSRENLWGFCKTCYYADVCKAGCTWTSHVLFGRAGNNPYCDYRANNLAAQGVRECIERLQKAPGLPFDHGRFALRYEDLQGNPLPYTPEQVSDLYASALPSNTSSLRLETCYHCRQMVYQNTALCPFCNADVQKSARAYRAHQQSACTAQQNLRAHLHDLVSFLQDGEPPHPDNTEEDVQ